MSLLRRGILLVSLAVIVVCGILLLNFTASNPTSRRYSSEIVVTTEESQIIGQSGEAVLAKDLKLPNNNDSNQKQCLCSRVFGSTRGACNVCMVEDNQFITGTYRIPDFVSPNFIAESKNRQRLLTIYQDQVDQLSDYTLAARLLNRPLWVYVRVNTLVDSEFVELAESTGGGVVYYFAVPGYVDPVDQGARTGLLVAAPIVLLMCLWELQSRRRIIVIPLRPAPNPKSRDVPKDPLRKANDAAEFAQRTKDKTRHQINIDEEYIDL